MKILFLGSLEVGQTSRMRMEVLRQLGHTPIPLDCQLPWIQADRLTRRVQQGLCRGNIVSYLNQAALELVREHKPELLWAEKQEYLYPETLEKMRRAGLKLIHYTPDPYFTLKWKRTRLSDACMPLYDHVVTSKRYELTESRKVCRQVSYMPLGFGDAVHRPMSPADRALRERFSSDVAFLGGWEARREMLLDAIAREVQGDLKIWGYGWDHLADGKWTLRRWWAMRRNAAAAYRIRKNERLAQTVQGGEVYGDQYVWALSGAKINVGFLRTVCPDQHTTRTFEIPACGSLLLADRTEEHQEFFTEGEEADYFSSVDELTDKIRFYLRNEPVRERLALNGYRKCHAAGYSYQERMRALLTSLGLA